jgi:hypothetical protein
MRATILNAVARVFLLLLAAFPGQAQEAITVVERREVALGPAASSPSHRISLSLVFFKDGGWTAGMIVATVRESAKILAQCGIALTAAELVELSAPERYRYYETSASRELARAIPFRKPALFFVIDTRQQPAFDAEAIGRGNSRSRPELADTVWITRNTRDPGVALAHELAHVLMDSGEHSDAPGNLMRDETAPENTVLTDAQCARMKNTGLANGLVK